MPSFVFHFHKKNQKRNTVHPVRFHGEITFKKNYLKRSRLALWLFSQAWSTCYSRASLCQVS